MKRKISLFLAATLIFSTCLIPAASAAALETAPAEENVNLSEAITPRALTIPTTMAPASWYNTRQYFTCSSYVYSSYIFEAGSTVSVFSLDKQITLEVYNTDNEPLMDPIEGRYWELYGFTCYAEPTEDYYIVIRNTSGIPITYSDAYYYEISK